jgi:PAS domain S-box-containing protein
MIKDKKPCRILVIEDNHGDFAIVEEFLTEHFLYADVVRTVNFKETKAILNVDTLFNIILLDLTLPDKNGPDLVAEMLESASCPIIILTGYSDIDFSIKSISKGILDYLLKDDLNAAMLYKSIIYSIERRKAIAELKESEQRYSDLFHLSPQPMWVVDRETSLFLDVNDAAITNYGYSRKEFLLITTTQIIAKQNTNNSQENEFNSDEYNQSFFKDIIVTHQKKNGELMHVNIESNFILFKNKKATLVLAKDVTEKIKYVGAIEKQNKKLQEIAWTQSHVVRAPLARMMGIVNLIKELNIASPECAELLEHFNGSANELDNIIKDITKKTEHINIKIN